MGLSRLYESKERKSKGLFAFLDYIEQHHKIIFSNDLKVKEELERVTDIDYITVQKYKVKLRDLNLIINNLISWRDKSYAHNDKKNFANKGKLGAKYPITYEDIEILINTADEILTEFQVGFNGKRTLIVANNIYDVDRVIKALL